MTEAVFQTSFHAGEWAPALNARVDLAKYRSAVALGENYFVDYRGGLSSRTGTKYVLQAYDSGEPVRMISFQASADVAYALEFGHLYMRPFSNGAPVLKTPIAITGISNAATAVVQVVNTFTLGNWVYISGVNGMTQVNNRYFKIIARTGTQISLGDLNGVAINSTAYGVWTSGGTVAEQFLLPTTYVGTDLALLKFTQNVDTMILCHPGYNPRVLTLIAPTNWTIADIVFGPAIGPTTIASVAGVNLAASATGVYYGYVVSTVNSDGQESVPSAPGLSIQLEDMRTVAGSISLSWAPVAGAASYNVYKAEQGHAAVPTGAQYGFIGNVTGTAFLDTNISPDFSLTPSISNNPFASKDPAVPAYFQQRLVLAGATIAPQTFDMSIPGDQYNYNYSNPSQPDDGISQQLISQQLNTIKAMIPVPTGLIMMTDRAAWLVNAGESNAPVTPGSIVGNLHSFNGISDVPPIIANFDILIVQAKGSIVRNISYKFEPNVFAGTDISVLSSHLFYGYQIREWCWAEEPFKLAYAVRDDGTLLNLTFLKEQELIGWCHSITGPHSGSNGNFKSVCSVVEGTDFGDVDAVYTVVERIVNGFTVKYIERFAERINSRQTKEDAWCVDSALAYDGAPATTFSNLWHLVGQTVTGLADGEVITPQVVTATGTITLPSAASKVIVGLAFTPKFQTLRLETGGQQTDQGKPKKLAAMTVRVQDTLGLQIGSTFDAANLVDMSGLVDGNLNEQDNVVVDGLFTGDARSFVDPNWSAQAQVCIKQPLPYPATILGVIPEFEVAEQ